MAQEKMRINGSDVKQPDEGLGYNFETTYSDDTVRVQSGVMHLTALFTVESFSYSATNLTSDEMSAILQKVAKGRRFKLHYRSPYYGKWRDDYFYVGKGSLKIGTWKEKEERYDSLSFNMIGVNPL